MHTNDYVQAALKYPSRKLSKGVQKEPMAQLAYGNKIRMGLRYAKSIGPLTKV